MCLFVCVRACAYVCVCLCVRVCVSATVFDVCATRFIEIMLTAAVADIPVSAGLLVCVCECARARFFVFLCFLLFVCFGLCVGGWVGGWVGVLFDVCARVRMCAIRFFRP